MRMNNRSIGVWMAAAALGWTMAAGAQQKEVGEQWEVTTAMSMQGMSIPGRPTKACVPKREDRLPIGDSNGECETYDIKHNGKTVTFKMRCTGKNAYTGDGEMTYDGPDKYKGRMNMLMNQGKDAMTMNMSGRKLGECDLGEQKRQVAAIQKQATDAQKQGEEFMAKSCADAVTNMTPQILKPSGGMKCEPKLKTQFCDKFQTQDGFSLAASRGASAGRNENLVESGQLCGVNPDQLRTQLCQRAEADESMNFLTRICVVQGYGKKIAARECAGRTYSSPPARKYSAFCSEYARRGLMKPGDANAEASADEPARPSKAAPGAEPPAPAAPEPKPADNNVINKGKDFLKGLFH